MAGIGRIRLKQETELNQGFTLEGEGFENLLLWGPRPGEAFTVSAPNGRLFRARITGLNERSAGMLVFEDMAACEPSCGITLLQALPEKERMELIIQKATELGAASINPLKSARSISLEERDSGQRKSHRWRDIALRAARQSRSPFITEVLPYRTLSEALSAAEGVGLKIALWERPGITHIRDALREARQRGAVTAAVLAGPEGGFTDEEMEEAKRRGFKPVSLGERILRAETAAIAAVALTRYELTG